MTEITTIAPAVKCPCLKDHRPLAVQGDLCDRICPDASARMDKVYDSTLFELEMVLSTSLFAVERDFRISVA
jgi:hypothetical protein